MHFLSRRDLCLDQDLICRILLTAQEMVNDYCAKADVDPEDPTCMRVVLVGNVENVTAGVAAYAKDALFDRHPGMKSWPSDHSFYVVALKPK